MIVKAAIAFLVIVFIGHTIYYLAKTAFTLLVLVDPFAAQDSLNKFWVYLGLSVICTYYM